MKMELTKILALCIVSAVAVIFLRQYRSEFAMLTALVSGVVIFFMLFSSVRQTLGGFYELFQDNAQISYCFKIALKALGISYLTCFAADMCRDFGQHSLAAKAELAGKFAIFLLAVPLLEYLLDMALGVANG